jgi:hypothetical protein
MRKKHPSPAIVLASLALLVSLSGTALAAGAVPLAKKALFANNAGKLQGKTARQVAAIAGPANTLNGKTADEIAATPGPGTTLEGKSLADVAATPGPASTTAGLVTVVSAPFSLAANAEGSRNVSCPAGTHVVSGGWTSNDALLSASSWPSADTAWTIYVINLSTTQAGSGTLYAVCLK